MDKPLEYADDLDDDEARQALCTSNACADPGCAAIEMTDALPEPAWVLNCAQDTTFDQVRYERRYAARPPASRRARLARRRAPGPPKTTGSCSARCDGSPAPAAITSTRT